MMGDERVTLYVRMSAEVKEALEYVRERMGLSLTETTERILRRGLNLDNAALRLEDVIGELQYRNMHET